MVFFESLLVLRESGFKRLRGTRRGEWEAANVRSCGGGFPPAVSSLSSRSLEVRRIRLPLGLRTKILHITDLHLRKPYLESGECRVVWKLSCSADVTAITGDLWDAGTPFDALAEFVSGLGGAKVAVLGNEEHETLKRRSSKAWLRALRELNLSILENEAVAVKNITVGGVDWFHGKPKIGRAYLSKVSEVDVLLSHTPDVIALRPRAKLVLAGHTHGGQVRLPVVGPPFVPGRYGRWFASGLFKVGGVYLHVSKGLGETLLPIRFNCRRDLTILEL